MKYLRLVLCTALLAMGGAACEEAGSPGSAADRGTDPIVTPDASQAVDASPGEDGARDGAAERDGGADAAAREDASVRENDAASFDAASDAAAGHNTDAALEAAAADAAAPGVRYGADVEPILKRHCTKCHASGAGAPFGLTFYEEVAPLANDIRSAVVSGTMPPCDLLGTIDCALSMAEVDTVRRWVEQGAAR